MSIEWQGNSDIGKFIPNLRSYNQKCPVTDGNQPCLTNNWWMQNVEVYEMEFSDTMNISGQIARSCAMEAKYVFKFVTHTMSAIMSWIWCAGTSGSPVWTIHTAARSQCKPASDVLSCTECGRPVTNLTAAFTTDCMQLEYLKKSHYCNQVISKQATRWRTVAQ